MEFVQNAKSDLTIRQKNNYTNVPIVKEISELPFGS